MLSIVDHRRDSAGLKYVYPVVSRRAGGVSVGINLNVNNACNWACVYCQVDNLTRGGPPPVDLDCLEEELSTFLTEAISGDFMQRQVPAEARRLVDVAFSGNGEPTSAPEFADAVGRVAAVLEKFGLLGKLPVRLITNGSLLHRPLVQAGIAQLATMQGEVWFKIDRGDAESSALVNGAVLDMAKVQANLARCAALAPTWVQTCWFALDGVSPSTQALDDYCALLRPLTAQLAGIHLYGLARPSLQPAAARLDKISADELQIVADSIQKKTGIQVLLAP
jgi:wyosine [tRNA(Phe)-imidazoG37] synthetase (radical SAM superfamily)